MAFYQIYIDGNDLVLQPCESDGTTPAGDFVSIPAKDADMVRRMENDIYLYYFFDKTTNRSVTLGIAFEDMFKNTSGDTFADEDELISFSRTQLGKSSAGGGGAKFVMYVGSQDDTGLLFTEVKTNDTGVDFEFNRTDKGSFEIIGFDPTIHEIYPNPYYVQGTAKWSSDDNSFQTLNSGLNSDATFEFGGWITIYQYE